MISDSEEITGKIVNILAYQAVITAQGENYTGEKDWALNKLRDLFKEELQKAREQRKGWKGYVAVDPKADNYKYSPVFSDRKGAELWVKGKEISGLKVVEVYILLVDHSELDQDKV